ncbi:MAG TPA: KH domain-containing protein [Patescibacteria group bacterium]|nr:KH domain-containing protein [Patescibacteria group bacterium]
MKDTLLFLLQKIVDHPDDIVIDESHEDTRMLLTIHANQEDIGKIIGKNGRIIKALRDLLKLMATKENVYVDLVLAEEVTEEQS